MKRKLRLKKRVKAVLYYTLALITMIVVINIALARLNKTAEKCDNYFGRTCSIYEIQRNR